MAHPLDGPRAKIKRAEKHLEEFDSERKTWGESSPYAILARPNSDKTEWTFRVFRSQTKVKHEVDVFGLIIGDYVHALRSALDHLVWQLVTVANGITPTDKTEGSIAFPVVTTHPKDFWSKPIFQRGDLTLEQGLMLEGFQPYRAIGMEKTTPLADLHALWNLDKHKLITPIKVTLSKVEGPRFFTNDVRLIGETKWDSEVALEDQTDVAWVTVEVVGLDPQVEVNRFTVDVTFGEAGRSIDNLPVLRDLTSGIVENCAHFFEKPAQQP